MIGVDIISSYRCVRSRVKIFYVDAIEGGIKERENKSVGTKRSVMGENQLFFGDGFEGI